MQRHIGSRDNRPNFSDEVMRGPRIGMAIVLEHFSFKLSRFRGSFTNSKGVLEDEKELLVRKML